MCRARCVGVKKRSEPAVGEARKVGLNSALPRFSADTDTDTGTPAHLSEIRDGIHHQALAGVNPRDEFHRIALRDIHGFFTTAYARAADIIQSVTPGQLGRGITELGLHRPSAI